MNRVAVATTHIIMQYASYNASGPNNRVNATETIYMLKMTPSVFIILLIRNSQIFHLLKLCSQSNRVQFRRENETNC